MNTFQALQHSIQEEIQVDCFIPPFLNKTVELFRKLHIYYRTYKQAKMHQQGIRNPSEVHPAIYGAALHLLGDYTAIGNYALTLALITKYAEDLLKEYRQLSIDYQKLCDALNGQYPMCHSLYKRQRMHPSIQLIPPSYDYYLKIQISGLIRQTRKIVSCALDLFWQLFKLSMCLCDVYFLCNNDTRMRYEGCTELIAEWNSYRERLKKNQQELINEIHKGNKLADRILKNLELKHDSITIINDLKNIIEKNSEQNNLWEDLCNAADETVDSFYVRGKITPLHINLTAVYATEPKLPYTRFPPRQARAVPATLKQPKNLVSA